MGIRIQHLIGDASGCLTRTGPLTSLKNLEFMMGSVFPMYTLLIESGVLGLALLEDSPHEFQVYVTEAFQAQFSAPYPPPSAYQRGMLKLSSGEDGNEIKSPHFKIFL